MEESLLSHLQLQFFTKDERYIDKFPNDVINVPVSSGPEQLNLLINKIADATSENWLPVDFDFIIDSILLRTTIFEFVEIYKFSVEDIINVECIQQTPAPEPFISLTGAEWIADLKTIDLHCVATVNYGGEITIWNSSTKAEKLATKKFDVDPLKCVDILQRQNELFLIAGAQNQTLVAFEMHPQTDNLNSKRKINLIPRVIFRGHQRSIECVAVNKEGTRALSGSFDKCLKVWNTTQLDLEGTSVSDNFVPIDSLSNENIRCKKAKYEISTKTPMVTLESHHEAVVDVCWDPKNSSQAVTVSWDYKMLVWDLELASPIMNFSSNKAFTSLSLNPLNGLAITGSVDPLIRLWDLRSREGSMVKSTYSGHLGWVTDVHWSPNNENLFVSSSFDKTVKMWDVRSPKAALYDLMGHEDRVLCVDWSIPERISSGSVDCSTKVFCARNR